MPDLEPQGRAVIEGGCCFGGQKAAGSEEGKFVAGAVMNVPGVDHGEEVAVDSVSKLGGERE